MTHPKALVRSMVHWLWLALTVIPAAWIEAEMRRFHPQANPLVDTPQTSRQPRWAPGGSGA